MFGKRYIICGRFTIQYTYAEDFEGSKLILVEAKGRNDPQLYNLGPTQDLGLCAGW